MKFVIRRFIFGIITAPIVVAIYAVAYGLLATLLGQTTIPQADVMFCIGITYVLCLVFAKQIAKLVSWITD